MPCQLTEAIEAINNSGNKNAIKQLKSIIKENQGITLGSNEEVTTQLGDRGIGNDKAYSDKLKSIQNTYNYLKDLEGTNINAIVNGVEYGVNKVEMVEGLIRLTPNKGPAITLGSDATATTEVEGRSKKAKYLRQDALRSTEALQNIAKELSFNPDSQYSKYIQKLLGNINTDYITNINLYMNKEADKNQGVINDNDIIIETSPTELGITAEMSGEEVYAHELIHSISKNILHMLTTGKANLEAQHIVQNILDIKDKAKSVISIDDLIPSQSLDKKKDREIATKRWNYMFNNPGKNNEGLHEFIAHGLTNPRLIQKLQRIKGGSVSNTKGNLVDTLLGLFKNLVDLLTGSKTWSQLGRNNHQVLTQLTFDLMKYNNKALNEIDKKATVESKVIKLLDNYGNKPLSKLVTLVSDKLEGEKGTLPPRPKKNAGKIANIIYLSKYLPKLLLREDMRGFREIVFTSLGMKPEGLVQNVIRDIENPTALERIIEKAGMMSDGIDRVRELTVAQVAVEIRESFGRQLTKVEEEVLTQTIVDTDLNGIYEQYGPAKVKNLITDQVKLKRQISIVKTQLGRLDRNNVNWNINQSVGLGYYLATHTAGIAQNLNSYNISSGVLSNKKRKANKKVMAKIDELATLVGLLYTNKEQKDLLAEMITNDSKGIDFIVKLANGAKKDARNRLFESDTHMIKGYSKEIFDDTIDLKVKPADQVLQMKAEGYELVKILKKDPNDNSKRPMAVYRSTLYVNNSYNRTATRMTDFARRGSSLSGVYNEISGDGLAYREAKLNIKQLDKARLEVAKQMQEGEYKIDIENKLSPVIDVYGNVVDYRYMMTKDNKKELMGQDKSVSEVLGRTLGSIQDKVSTIEQNDAVLKIILSDQKKNYVKGAAVGKNNKLYIVIEQNSPNAQVREIYNILPHNMKQAIMDSNDGYIAVRRDMLANYFGFRDPSIFTLIPGLDKITPQIIQKWVKVAEKLWQEIIKISKVDIIIRTPTVFIGNVISNIMYSIVNGANPLRVLKMQLANAKYVTKYLDNTKKLQSLKIKGVIGKDTENQIKQLEAEQKLNPVHDLMEAGMYQAIVEDLDKQTLKSGNRLVRRFDGITEVIPEFVRTGAKWMYLSEGTKVYSLVTQATQYSDFIARATEYQLLEERGIPKEQRLNQVLDAFVNYGKPASSWEEYANNMGAFMFTKYMKRIQRALRNSAKDKPVNVLLAVLAQEMFFEVDDIYDQNIFTRSWANLDQDWFEHIKRVITPTTLEPIL